MFGKVKMFDNRRGFGFITNVDGKDYFFHYSDINEEGYKTIEVDQKVDFEETIEKGKLRAKNIKKL